MSATTIERPASDKATRTASTASAFETVASLKLVVPAVRAIARYETALAMSPVRAGFGRALELVDASGAMQLDGHPVDVMAELIATERGRALSLARHLEARRQVRRELLAGEPDVAMVLRLASIETGAEMGFRTREVGAHDRDSLAAGQRLPRGADRLGAALADWLRFVTRGSGDMEPLLMIGIAHRRWLAFRPFTRANIALAQSLTALLLEAEAVMGEHGVLPLARRFSERTGRYRDALQAGATDEDRWLAFWLESVRASAADAREKLRHFEAHHANACARLSSVLGRELDETGRALVAAPVLRAVDLQRVTGLSRGTVARALDELVRAGHVRDLSGARERRCADDVLLRLLVD